MTNHERIREYYSQFDEWARLDLAEGRLEFEILMEIIREQIPSGATILDLGGGPGRYTAALSRLGYCMHLADLSPALIEIAHSKIKEHGDPAFVKSIRVAEATDLSAYESGSVDAVLLLGPLYHLTGEDEIRQCLRQVNRVLRHGGILIAVYIPWLSGLKSVMARAVYKPGQADAVSLLQVSDTGIFHNLGKEGFQEGCYLHTEQLVAYMNESGFDQLLLRSVRGLGNGMEAGILSLKEKDMTQYRTIMELILNTSAAPSVLDSSGHAVYVGRRP